jgi:hypothetical protein
MMTKSNKIILLAISLAIFTLAGCEDGSEQIAQLTEENSELRTNYQSQLGQTRVVTKSSDSLQTIVHSLQREIQKMKGEMPVYNASSEDEKAIEALVGTLHKGWTTMLKNDDTNELLKHFLPQYTTSAVRINTENIPSVQRSNNANFEEHLNSIMLANELSLSFGQTKFLYTEVKDDFFVTSYRTRLRVYENNKEVYSSSLVTLLAGQNKDGWKVGSYNWVTFNY